jgi:hypothetical protein
VQLGGSRKRKIACCANALSKHYFVLPLYPLYFLLYTSHGVIRFGLQAEFFRRNSLYFAIFEDYEVSIGLDGDLSRRRGRADKGV